MNLQELAPELVHQIFNKLPTISDVINLSLTCHRFHHLLRLAQKLPTLFAAAEREFGPIEDIVNLVAFNHSQPVHTKKTPPMSYALLRQIIQVGTVAKKLEQIYPEKRWNTSYLFRRSLITMEKYRLRRAVYRYWLYSEAFHNRNFPRSSRLIASVVDERAQLLRTWTTDELCEIEDLRMIFEDILMNDLCPTDGIVQERLHECSQYPIRMQTRSHHLRHSIFNSSDNWIQTSEDIEAPQLRKMYMAGWGDEITQYHLVQSLLKLNPPHLLHLYQHAIYKTQVDLFVSELGDDWFWNNGQTFLDTWLLVLHGRGLDPFGIREAIADNRLGITVDKCDEDNSPSCFILA